ncbi:MAG: sulfotransferase [Pseudomonadota bacterium]
MAEKQTFILGVGCQKAGTTWLWDYLNSLPEVSLTRPKELHIFDTMLRPELHSGFKHRIKAEHLARPISQKLREVFGQRDKRFVRPIDRVAMIEDPQVYVDFFRGFDPDASVVGEITPSYSTLLPQHFAQIRQWLEPHFDLRVVVLLRDPVARAFSATGQHNKVAMQEFPQAADPDTNRQFEALMDTHYIAERQDYGRLLDALDQAFEPERVHVEFFERLFTPSAVRSITDFLGVAYHEAGFDMRKNSAKSSTRLDPELAARARALYAPTYEYCRKRFGAELIDKLWTTETETVQGAR